MLFWWKCVQGEKKRDKKYDWEGKVNFNKGKSGHAFPFIMNLNGTTDRNFRGSKQTKQNKGTIGHWKGPNRIQQQRTQTKDIESIFCRITPIYVDVFLSLLDSWGFDFRNETFVDVRNFAGVLTETLKTVRLYGNTR